MMVLSTENKLLRILLLGLTGTPLNVSEKLSREHNRPPRSRQSLIFPKYILISVAPTVVYSVISNSLAGNSNLVYHDGSAFPTLSQHPVQAKSAK